MEITLEIIDGPDYDRDDSGWEHNAYTVELVRGDQRMRVPWRSGLGITEDPSARVVLESLLMDAAGFDNSRDIDDWAADYGFEKISEAVRTYRAVEEQTAQLREFLGDDFEAAVFPGESDDYDSERVARRLTADVEA